MSRAARAMGERAARQRGGSARSTAAASTAARGDFFVPGHNCWRVERAQRFRCVQDGEEYFRLVREALLSAQRSVFILGWDIRAGVDLLPAAASGETEESQPTRLGPLLDFIVRRNPDLHCYVLIWDYAEVYALERDPFSRLRLSWGTHRRVHFRYDDQHPLGASHHQKVVVVDDRLAFSGGLDLTGHRWDTPEHACEHPLRTNSLGQPYAPFHDVQALVEGPIAASLGELARERWRRSKRSLFGRERLPPVLPARGSAWPESAAPDLTDVEVAIARTEPRFGRRPSVRECEQLFLDSIAAARRSIYIENQYFTSALIADVLARRLREAEGPEVIAVGPKSCSGWLEEQTMGALRREFLAELVRADAHGRLRLLCTFASRERDVCTFIHSKVLIVDDEFLRIGSANLTNRSMGMDTECDLAVAAHGDERVRSGIRAVRERLLAEHLGAPLEEVRARFARAASLRAAIDAFPASDHGVAPLEVQEPDPADARGLVRLAADPGEPMLLTRTVERLLPEIDTAGEYVRVAALALPLCAMGAAWITLVRTAPRGLGELLTTTSHDPRVWLWMLAASVAGGLCFVPLEILVLVSVVLFGPLLGAPLALSAALIDAALGYAAGRALGLSRVIPYIGRRAYRVWCQLPGRGVLAVAMLRLVSLLSATSIHLLCGAARVPFLDYAAGTAAVFVPGVLVLALVGGLLRHTSLHPGPWSSLVTAAAAITLAAFVLRIRRRFLVERYRAAEGDQEERALFG